MTPPPHLRADRLWRRLAEAQDAALRQGLPPAPLAARARRPRTRRIAAALLLSGAAAAGLLLFAHRTPRPPVRAGAGSQLDQVAQLVQLVDDGQEGRTLVADARSDLPLQFSNGSSVTFRAGSTGRMQRLKDDGAQVFLQQGRLEAHVVHTPTTLWMVHAGPYRVRVTGTRFTVSWAAARLEVALFEGSVVIDGAELGAGVPLRAGQRLSVDRGVVRTELLAPAGSSEAIGDDEGAEAEVAAVAATTSAGQGAPAGAAAPAGARSATATPAAAASAGVRAGRDEAAPITIKGRIAADDGEWFALAKQSAYAESFAAAMRVGWRGLCHRLDAHRLLTLGDVARYAQARERARQAFEALVMRFPHDPLAADAVFSLGRLAFESDQSDRAARWFRRYVDDWPHGPLADQAVGRLVECAIRMHDSEAARSAARAYLLRAPTGPHARLARQVLRDVLRDGTGSTASAVPSVLR